MRSTAARSASADSRRDATPAPGAVVGWLRRSTPARVLRSCRQEMRLRPSSPDETCATSAASRLLLVAAISDPLAAKNSGNKNSSQLCQWCDGELSWSDLAARACGRASLRPPRGRRARAAPGRAAPPPARPAKLHGPATASSTRDGRIGACAERREARRLVGSHGKAMEPGSQLADQPGEADVQLLTAAATGDLPLAKRARAAGASLDATEPQKSRCAMHQAAAHGCCLLIEYLLAEGAPVDQRTLKGHTPLHAAAVAGQSVTAELLIAEGANPSALDRTGAAPLHWAAQQGHAALVELLVSHGASTGVIGSSLQQPLPPLHRAAIAGHLAVVQLLLRTGHVAVDTADCNQWTALHYTAQKGQDSVAQLLLERGAQPNVRADRGRCPLHVATRNGHDCVARLLLSHRAAVDARNDDGFSPLHWAALHGHSSLCKLLLEHGGQRAAVTAKGVSALHLAAHAGRLECAEMLLDGDGEKTTPQGGASALVDVRDEEGRTALHEAAEGGHEDLVSLLLSIGASPYVKDIYGDTPWNDAQEAGHTQVVALIWATLTRGSRPRAAQSKWKATAARAVAMQRVASKDAAAAAKGTGAHRTPTGALGGVGSACGTVARGVRSRAAETMEADKKS